MTRLLTPPAATSYPAGLADALHDDVAQSLAAARFAAERARRGDAGALDDVLVAVRQASADLRRVLHALRATTTSEDC